jgi:hypothetical protein
MLRHGGDRYIERKRGVIVMQRVRDGGMKIHRADADDTYAD